MANLHRITWGLAVAVIASGLMACGQEDKREISAQSGEFTFRAGAVVSLAPEYRSSSDSGEVSGELAALLQKMIGTEVGTQTDGKTGIVLATAADFPELAQEFSLNPADPFGREDYVIRSEADRLLLIGATAAGTRMAVADLLHRWGYRQFFPGKAWEIIPKSEKLTLNVSEVQRPAYYFRDIFTVNYLPGEEADFKRWSWLNRLGSGFQLNTRHAYGAIAERNSAAFQEHPEYYLPLNGKSAKLEKYKKFDAANAGLRELLIADSRAQLMADSRMDSVSMEPSDFGGWADAGATFDTIGGASNQAVTLANAVAKQAAEPLKKFVGMYAYYDHQFPPTIPVEPNVIVSFASRFLKPDRDLYESIQAWRDQGVNLVGIRDYHSYWDWDLALPGRALGGNLHYLETTIPKLYESGARFYTSESQSAWGAYGLGFYLTPQLLWNPRANPQTFIADFLEKSFGPAAEPMGRFYRLLNGEDSVEVRYLPIDRFYATLLEAFEAADGRKDVQRRLSELLTYVRYVELMANFEKAREDQKPAALAAVYDWVLRAAPMQMLPTKAIALRNKSGLRSVFRRYTHPASEELARRLPEVTPITAEELISLAKTAVDRPVEKSAIALRSDSQNVSSPWMRYSAAFVFPLGANESVDAALSMRRFGFSEFPRYVILDPQGRIARRGELRGIQDTVTIQSKEAGNYSLITETTPNLVKCQADRNFYLNPPTDTARLDLVSFRGSLYFECPPGSEVQIAAGGQGENEKVSVNVTGESGPPLASGESVDGNVPVIVDLPVLPRSAEYQVQFGKPITGDFEDLFFKFNASNAGPVALVPEAFPAQTVSANADPGTEASTQLHSSAP